MTTPATPPAQQFDVEACVSRMKNYVPLSTAEGALFEPCLRDELNAALASRDAEIAATDRQVEILTDDLHQSRKEIAALREQVAEGAQSQQSQAMPGPTMADAVAAGYGTLHGAIDHWQERALKAEQALAAPVVPAAWVDTNDLTQIREKGRGWIVFNSKQDGYEQTPLFTQAAHPVQPAAPPILPQSLLNLIGEYGMARTDKESPIEVQHRWMMLIAGIKQYASAFAATAHPVQPADHVADASKMVPIRFTVAQASGSKFAYVLDGWGLTYTERFDTSKDSGLDQANMRARYLNQISAQVVVPDTPITTLSQPGRDALDAARYRWLRYGDNDEPCMRPIGQGRYLLRNEELDKIIDAAIVTKEAHS